MKKFRTININQISIKFILFGVLIIIAMSPAEIWISKELEPPLPEDEVIDSTDEAIGKENTLSDTPLYEEIERLSALGEKEGITIKSGHRLYIDNKKYFLKPAQFMAKQHPADVCITEYHKGQRKDLCKDGRPIVSGAQIFIEDSAYHIVGYHNIKINYSWSISSLGATAVGTGDKKKNEILVTVGYSPFDENKASKTVGKPNNWGLYSMTLLLRVKVENGKVIIEQDDSCLGNPNPIETIPDARKLLKKCKEK